MKTRGLRPRAFSVFECLETLMKDDARVFEIASQSCLRNKRNGTIHEFFTCCRNVSCYEEVYCYGDLPFKKGFYQCYHNAVENQGLILNYLLSSAMALSHLL